MAVLTKPVPIEKRTITLVQASHAVPTILLATILLATTRQAITPTQAMVALNLIHGRANQSHKANGLITAGQIPKVIMPGSAVQISRILVLRANKL